MTLTKVSPRHRSNGLLAEYQIANVLGAYMATHEFPKDCIAVLGGATHYSSREIVAAFQVGREIGRCGKIVITGATTGIPYAAAIGAKLAGTLVIGISPAANAKEHLSIYRKPLVHLDAIIFTGMGLEGRNPINVRSVNGAVFIGGGFGTLSEFSAACAIGNKVLGILEDSGGACALVPKLLDSLTVSTDTCVLSDVNPVHLARRICAEVDQNRSLKRFESCGNEMGSDVREIIHAFIAVEKAELQNGKRQS